MRGTRVLISEPYAGGRARLVVPNAPRSFLSATSAIGVIITKKVVAIRDFFAIEAASRHPTLPPSTPLVLRFLLVLCVMGEDIFAYK